MTGNYQFFADKDVRDHCKHLASIGLTSLQIALYYGFDKWVVDKACEKLPEFKKALLQGRVRGLARVAETLYSEAVTGDNMTATIFYLKTQGGWAPPEKKDGEKKSLEQIIQDSFKKVGGKISVSAKRQQDTADLLTQVAGESPEQGPQIVDIEKDVTA